MLRDREEALLDFCQAQRAHFDPEAWPDPDPLTASERAAAAAFLGRIDWYGHQAELLEIAARLAPNSGGDAIALAREVGLSFSRFSQSLKARLAYEAKRLARLGGSEPQLEVTPRRQSDPRQR